MRLYILVCLFFFMPIGVTVGQTVVSLEKLVVRVIPDSAYTLIGRVDPNSITVVHGDSLLDNIHWRFDAELSAWVLTNRMLGGIDLLIRYRTSPRVSTSLISAPKYRVMKTDSTGVLVGLPTNRLSYTRSDIFGSSTIQRSGSLTRGITFGSNRDASIESGLRLDLSGNITDDVEILATLTDQSTPIQPDGSTQTLREFDQVFIRLKSSMGQLQLGDVDVTLQRSRFARVNRRLQGADIIAHAGIGDQRATASVARGVFRSQTLAGIDGVQGPYRLAGASGETFVIVLAGTETIYLDGRRLARGEENDYVIDYGLGEITFTNRHFINSKSRISVDFQYISQQYTRSLVAAESQARNLLGGRLDLGASVIREADGDNPNAQLLLSPFEIGVLRRAGDDPTKAVVSGVEPYGQNETDQRVRYIRRDTLLNGREIIFYKADPTPTETGYAIRFSRSETGLGSYVRSGSSLNGFVYQWVGEGRGDYDTLRTLAAPTEKMVASVDMTYRLNDQNRIYAEFAGSRIDLNRFSPISESGNQGSAWVMGLNGGNNDRGAKGFRYDVQHSSLSKNVAFFDRPREVEFDRKWNITDGEQAQEQQSNIFGSWRSSPYTDLTATGGMLRRERIRSDRIETTIRSEEPNLANVAYTWSYVHSRDSLSFVSGGWQRHNADISKPLSGRSLVITPGFRLEHENRDQRDLKTDSISFLSLRFTDLNPSLSFRDASQRWGIRLSGSYRTDHLPLAGEIRDESRSLTRSVGWMYDAGRRFSTEQEIGLRDVDYTEAFKTAQSREDNRSVQVRSVIRYSMGGRFIEGQWNYDLRSERRAKLQERYFEVGPELGSFIWEDINGDGIQDIDEFFPERIPGEGTFLLQYVPGDDFIPVTSLETGLRHTVRFGEWNRYKQNDSWIKRLEISSRLTVRESSSDRLENIYTLPIAKFQGALTQQGRISSTSELRLTQSEHRLGVRVIHDYSKSANRLVQGLDTQQRNTTRGIAQFRIDDTWSFEWDVQSGIHSNTSELLASRGFNIRSVEINPVIYANFSRRLIGSFTTGYISRTDRLPLDPVDLRAWLVNADGTMYHGRGARTRLSVGRRVNNLTGVSSAYGLYELTDGGTAGVVWSGSVQSEYRLSDFIRASLNYDMRKFPSRPMIQTMRVVISAVL
jgi:hypothetical protein